MDDETTLKVGEYHPSANSAMEWYREWKGDVLNSAMSREALASSALAGNRLAQICNGTLDRLDKGEAVSDRYLLGLVWMLKNLMEASKEYKVISGK